MRATVVRSAVVRKKKEGVKSTPSSSMCLVMLVDAACFVFGNTDRG